MVDSRKAYAYFSSQWSLRKSTNNWWSFNCPYCGKPKSAVHFDYEIVKCWVCSTKVTLVNFVAEFENIHFKDALQLLWNFDSVSIDMNLLEALEVETVMVSDISLPLGYKPILYGDTSLGTRARNYLESRELDLKYLSSLGFGYVNEHDTENEQLDYWGYIIIPFNTPKGELYYYIGRDYTGNFLRYKNPPVSNFGIGKSELLFNEAGLNRNTMVLTEGAFCASTIGKSGVASLGKDLSVKQVSKIITSDCENVVIFYDKGAYIDGVKAAMKLMDHKNVYVVDTDNFNGDKEQKDPNSIGLSESLRLIEDTPPLTYAMALDAII